MITAIIPTEFEPFISAQLTSGKYRSAEEIVGDALRLLRENALESLRERLQVGIDELDRSEGIVIENEAGLKDFFDDIEAEGQREIEAERAR